MLAKYVYAYYLCWQIKELIYIPFYFYRQIYININYKKLSSIVNNL